METKIIELEVPKEISEVGEALGAVLKAVGVALEDGFQPGEDIPVIVTSAVANLGVALGGIQNVPREFMEDPTMAILGVINPVALGIKEVVKLLKK